VITRIRGLLIEKQPPSLVLDLNGLGYEIEAPMSTFARLPALGQEVLLFTHLVVREDAHLLFGFGSLDERRLFRALLKISGVGPKLALTILSGIDVHEFAQCIADSDSAKLSRLPGIGKKTAERLIVEMRDRIADWGAVESVASGVSVSLARRPTDAATEAVQALISLGYKPQEASRYVHAIDVQGLSSEEIIRQALKATVRG
jgi:Holliday junction DNA helicase RuvA